MQHKYKDWGRHAPLKILSLRVAIDFCTVAFTCYVFNIHSPREIISMAGKTGHDARWKRKQS